LFNTSQISGNLLAYYILPEGYLNFFFFIITATSLFSVFLFFLLI
jgi:hypothetical protein